LNQNKAKKIGRPKLPKGEAKGCVVPVRFTPDDIKAVAQAAKASKKTVSEWIRNTLDAAIQR
jgi:predicted HicB family RNase H-like nuclease